METKIPPPFIALLFAFLTWILYFIPSLRIPPSFISTILAIFLLIFGFLIIFISVKSFKNAVTTLDPRKPETTTTLIKNGVYKYTRNPMYLGLCSFLASWSFYLSTIAGICCLFGFIAYINHFQIKPEEKYLEQIFKNEYIEYKLNVRRWI